MKKNKEYTMSWVYMLECADNSLYTGYTTDIHRRMREHSKGTKTCKYTASNSRRPVRLVALWEVELPKNNAMSVEYFIKSLSRDKKVKLIDNPSSLAYIYQQKTGKIFNIEHSICKLD